jgi:FkbM family methyltransferase
MRPLSRIPGAVSAAGRRLRARLARAAFGIALRPRRDRDVTYMGTSYGGAAVPSGMIDSSWVCYTAGVGEDASFDLALARMGCDVVAIDPTPRAIEYMKPLLIEYPNLRLVPYAVWTADTEIDFFPPADPVHVSFSATNRQHTSEPIRVPARTIASIAEELGHKRVDLLKLDIEGAEYGVLDSLDLGRLGVRVLCVEYHNDQGFWSMLKAARSIIRRGYQVSAVRRTDVTFVHEQAHRASGS